MASHVAPQVDVGSLTLRGLTQFTPLLAALTADDVAPFAMIQLESLGALFHINGQYAAKVPDMLSRSSSVRLDQLGMLVGWRKGDAASLMAQSAGGQAVAMLCFCLKNTCQIEDIGSILYELSDRVLSRNLSISSIAQLTKAADLLAAKLQVIGFGNTVAKQVVRIHDVYDHMGKVMPPNFFESMTRQSLVDLHESFTKVFQQEDTLIRISGIHAMGHIMAIVLTMFSESVMLVVEGLLVQEAAQASIILEIDSLDSKALQTTIRLEDRLCKAPQSPWPIEVDCRCPSQTSVRYTFQWAGHVTDGLRIAFANLGVRYSASLIQACCDLLLLAVPLLRGYYPGSNNDPLPSRGFVDLLGCQATEQIYRVCKLVFDMTPSSRDEDFLSAYSRLVKVFQADIGSAISCAYTASIVCDLTQGWATVGKKARADSVKSCLHRVLWRSVGSALHRTLQCLLIDAETNVTTSYDPYDIKGDRFSEFLGFQLDNLMKHPKANSYMNCDHIHRDMMILGGQERWHSHALALSDGSCTIYPATLLWLQTDLDRGHRYNLCDGQLLVKGRYYRTLKSLPAKIRQGTSKSLFTYKNHIKPSAAGEHTRLDMTIRETLECLELRTTMLTQGCSIHLDLARILCSSLGLNDCEECEHSLSDKLDLELHADVLTTTIAMPHAKGRKIAIVQTKDNPEAQLLVCGNGKKTLLQLRCCLNCAARQAKEGGFEQIIVA